MFQKSIETKQKIWNWIAKHGRLPNRRLGNADERAIAYLLENRLSKKSGSYDPEFDKQIRALYPRGSNRKRSHDPAARIRELFGFIEKKGRLPSRTRPKENRIFKTMDNYILMSGPCFNSEVREIIMEVDPYYGNSAVPYADRPNIDLKPYKDRIEKLIKSLEN